MASSNEVALTSFICSCVTTVMERGVSSSEAVIFGLSDLVTIAERSPTTVSFSTLSGVEVVVLFRGVAWVVATPCLGVVVVLAVAAIAVEDPTKETADAMRSAGQALRRGEREDMKPRGALILRINRNYRVH